MKRRLLRFLFVAVALCIAYSIYILTERYPTTQPAPADLVDTYFPTPETKLLILKRGGYKPQPTSIVIREDGTFRFEEVPDWWRAPFGESKGGFDTGSGTWQTVHEQGWWMLELTFTDTKNFSGPAMDRPAGTLIQILGQNAPFDLAMNVGDPDEGKEMHFTKSATTTQP